jgi:O-antigen/teichoic acid export membrane protein
MIGIPVKDLVKKLFNEDLFRNSFYIMFSTGTMAAFGFIFWLVVAHLYKPDQLGIASTLVSSMIFISYLSLLGFNNAILRFLPLSKNRNEQIDTSIILVALSAVIVSSAFVLFAPHFSVKLDILRTNLFYSISFVVMCVGASLNLIADNIYIAYRSAGYNFVLDGIIGGGIQLIIPFLAIGLGSYGIYAAQGSSTFVAMVLSFIFLYRRFHYQPRIKINEEILINVLHYSLWSYTSSLLSILPTIVLPIIILNKLGAAAAGYYYLAYMMANVLFSIAYAVSQSLFAEGSYGERELIQLAKRALLFLAATVIPASIILGGAGPFVLDIFGKTYGSNARDVVMILAATGPFLAINVLGNVILSIEKKLKTLSVVSFIYAAFICVFAYLWATKGLAWIAFSWLAGNILSAALIFSIIIFQHKQKAKLHSLSLRKRNGMFESTI